MLYLAAIKDLDLAKIKILSMAGTSIEDVFHRVVVRNANICYFIENQGLTKIAKNRIECLNSKLQK